jgi:MFS family permease
VRTASAERPVTYRQVMATAGWRPWALTTLLSRVPDAMAPLALVLLGHQAGSFAIGGLASGAHAITEAALAPWLGALADRWRPHRYVRAALAARAVTYAVLAATATAVPPAVLVVLAGIAGGVGAGIPGQLRALLARITEQRLLHPAMSLDTTLLELAWTVAPAGVAALAALGDARLAVAAMSLLAATAALTALRLPAAPPAEDRPSFAAAPAGRRRSAATEQPSGTVPADNEPSSAPASVEDRLSSAVPAEDEPSSSAVPAEDEPSFAAQPPSGAALTGSLWRAAAPSLALGMVGGFSGGALDTAVPPTLDSIGSAASLAGVLFTGYSLASLLGGLVYGARRWPGPVHRQAAILLTLLCAVLLPAALVPSLPVVAVCVVAAGLFAAPQITARSLALQQDLPEAAWSAGFSSLYAANGAGYGLAGFAVGALLPAGAHTAFAVPLAVCIAAACLAFLQSPPPPHGSARPERAPESGGK